jgi:hypothetical protein
MNFQRRVPSVRKEISFEMTRRMKKSRAAASPEKLAEPNWVCWGLRGRGRGADKDPISVTERTFERQKKPSVTRRVRAAGTQYHRDGKGQSAQAGMKIRKSTNLFKVQRVEEQKAGE